MRKELDKYYTPDWAYSILYTHLQNYFNGSGFYQKHIIDPCSGQNEIIKRVFSSYNHPNLQIYTNDIDPSVSADQHDDALKMDYNNFDWIITNPPFNNAWELLAQFSTCINIALLLRLSFLEPTLERWANISIPKPSKLIVLPRISFTGDGKKDLVTCAWMIWSPYVRREIAIIPKGEVK